jgi:hypothetical protein
MSELNRTEIDVDIDTNKYNAVEIGGVNYYRKDWMVWKMVGYAKDKVGQMSERIKELEALVSKNESLHDVSNSVCPKCGYPKFKKYHEDFERCNGCDWTSK